MGSRYETTLSYGSSVYTQHDSMDAYFSKKNIRLIVFVL